MKKETYTLLENYMLSCMEDSAHDKEHVYRVLYYALEIAKMEKQVDHDVLICACLLHDIGRREQYENPAVCHAAAGGKKAYRFLLEHGFEASFAQRVKECIQTHRFRRNCEPQSIEAKILFDADKLDVTGATGIARTLLYKGIVSELLYTVMPDGSVSNGEDAAPSFLHEYKFKLEKLYSNFYTPEAAKIAQERKQIAADFYRCLYREVSMPYQSGRKKLDGFIQ